MNFPSMLQLIGVFTTLFAQALACDSSINLTPNVPFTLSSNNYRINGPFRCNVIFNAPPGHVVRSNCNGKLPNSIDCTSDRLEFSPVGYPESMEKYCGTFQNLQMDSAGNKMTMALIAPVLSAGSRFTCKMEAVPSPCGCGLRNPVERHRVRRIVGGSEAGINEFPMMAGLVDAVHKELYCGATIINPKTVVTAAHCVDQKDDSKIGVVVGEHDIKTYSETNYTRLYRVYSVIKHEDYQSDEEISSHDIALVTILGTMEFSYGVSAVCLPYRYENDNIEGMTVEALGWGLLGFGGSKATTLQKVSLDVTSSEQCRQQNSQIGPEHFCTFTQDKDTCQMDSGGPLLYTDDQNVVYLFGVISTSTGCASDSPSYHTKVMSYWKWIEQHTPDTRYCST